MTKPAEHSAPPLRTWRPMAAWTGALLLTIVIGGVALLASRKAKPGHDQYRTIGNGRFGFLVDIPAAWKAEDRSDNGDGFFLLTGDGSVDVRVYGCHVMPENDWYTEKKADPHWQPKVMRFSDGKEGVSLRQADERYFIRTSKDAHVVFYVKANDEWATANEQTLNKVAGSLYFEPETEPRKAKERTSAGIGKLRR